MENFRCLIVIGEFLDDPVDCLLGLFGIGTGSILRWHLTAMDAIHNGSPDIPVLSRFELTEIEARLRLVRAMTFRAVLPEEWRHDCSKSAPIDGHRG